MAARKKSNKKKNILIIVAVLVIVILVALIVVLYATGVFDSLLQKAAEIADTTAEQTDAQSPSDTSQQGTNTPKPNATNTVRGASEGVIDGTPIAIYFVNVGQGDAIVLDLPDDKCMLIDGGTTKNPPQGSAKTIHSACLQEVVKNNIIDYLIVTHSDTDHYSLLSAVLDAYEVKNIYFNDVGIGHDPVFRHALQSFRQRVLSFFLGRGRILRRAAVYQHAFIVRQR